ncbi:hypothetical protein PILCRDRAFT_5091 [Piloderma croceum F 1598]|uniref:Uncharacterized protein n=1 Tax=Piloderma croceum (strain F 1598) TaxID=765440 RepID=A0A0C3FPE7_PILCF|nr:hypothetical protein PILCRDRAFT_5091 [Piloderma croceum F 1598]
MSSRSTTHKPFILHKPARASAQAVAVGNGIFDELSSMLEDPNLPKLGEFMSVIREVVLITWLGGDKNFWVSEKHSACVIQFHAWNANVDILEIFMSDSSQSDHEPREHHLFFWLQNSVMPSHRQSRR